MKITRSYLTLWLKKIRRHTRVILLMTVFLLLALSLTARMLLRMDQSDESRQRVRIGITGDFDDVHLGIGFSVIENLDDISISLELLEMEEEEARRALEGAEISAYIRVPENYISDIVHGRDVQFDFVMRRSSAAAPAALLGEIIKAVSPLVTESERGIYAMTEYGYRIQTPNLSDKNVAFTLRYIEEILSRADTVDLHEIGIRSLSLAEYYICGIAAFFLLLFPVACASLFADKHTALEQLLVSRNVPSYRLVLCEYTAYTALLYSTAVLLMLAGAVLSAVLDIGVEPTLFLRLPLTLIPCVMMLSAMQIFLYECTEGVVSGVFAQFITAVVLAYLSGCFYPYYFFPMPIREIGAALPSGILFGFLRGELSGDNSGALLPCLLYTGVFLALAVLLRQTRLRRKNG